MIDGRGRVRITDFGLAGTVEELAAEGVIAGTPAYMAPEQQSTGTATVQSDIFSLGLVLYEIFTGKRATDVGPAPDPTKRGDSSRSDSSVRIPSSVAGGIDPAVERVILRCLERDPNNRPRSAYAVFGALPGGDPLAAAVAAGETPSPDLVANAGVEGSVPPLHAGIAVLVTILSFLGISAIQTPLFEGLGKPPSVLSARADEILTRVTGHSAPRYSSDGLRYSPEVKDSTSHADSLAAKKSKPTMKAARTKQYWRRWSPMPFNMENVHAARSSLVDPPQAYPGSGEVVLDMGGRLLALEALPPSDADTSAQPPPNWNALLDAAGRDPARVRAVAPPAHFTAHADTIVAWRLSDSTAAETTLVAAAIAGHIVRVDTFTGKDPSGRLAVRANDEKPSVQGWFFLTFFLLVPFFGSLVLAANNIRAKRGDVRGALVVGISIAVFYLLEHLFATNVGEVGLFGILLSEFGGTPMGHALLHATTMALAYLAIEPYMRRLWPSVLVSWARLVAGRIKDPIIGRDILVGAAAGAVISIAYLGVQVLERRLGLSVDPMLLPSDTLDSMVSAPVILSSVSYAVAIAFLRATQFYTILVVLRFVLRRDLLTVIGGFILFSLVSIDFSSKGLMLEIPLVLVSSAIYLLIALRYGYVAAMVGLFISNISAILTWTLNLSSWVGPQTMFAWGILLALLGYGFLTAVGGKSIFSDPLSDPVGARPPRR
jgi:serine/threonine-protein kinase